MGGDELYRTVLEAFTALRAAVPDEHRNAALRREVQGMCILTAPFNESGPSFHYAGADVPHDIKIRMMRRVIMQYADFMPYFTRTRADRRRAKIARQEHVLFDGLLGYAREIKSDSARTAHFFGDNLYYLTVKVVLDAVVQSPTEELMTAFTSSAYHIGEQADELLYQTYVDRGIMRAGAPDLGNRALLEEHDFFERVLRRNQERVHGL